MFYLGNAWIKIHVFTYLKKKKLGLNGLILSALDPANFTLLKYNNARGHNPLCNPLRVSRAHSGARNWYRHFSSLNNVLMMCIFLPFCSFSPQRQKRERRGGISRIMLYSFNSFYRGGVEWLWWFKEGARALSPSKTKGARAGEQQLYSAAKIRDG